MEHLPLGRIATLVPDFAVKDLPLGRTLMMMMMMRYIYTVEPRYSEQIGGVVCSDSEMRIIRRKKKVYRCKYNFRNTSHMAT